MGDLEVRTTARLQYAEEGRDLSWRFFYQEDIVELRAQVARLEGELAEVQTEADVMRDCRNDATLSRHDYKRCYLRVKAERDAAYAAIRAKDAALREHGCDFVYPSPVRQPAPCLEHWGDNSAEAKEQWCSTCTALSDAGKGWLPPEWWKGKMFRHILGVLSGACDPSCGACALDALKGVK